LLIGEASDRLQLFLPLQRDNQARGRFNKGWPFFLSRCSGKSGMARAAIALLTMNGRPDASATKSVEVRHTVLDR
jgi:hypothetical protein